MIRIVSILFFVISIVQISLFSCTGESDTKKLNGDNIKGPIDSNFVDKFLEVNPEFISQRKKLLKFYSRRNFSLAWFEKNDMVPQAGMFIDVIKNIENEGIPQSKLSFPKLTKTYNDVLQRKGKKAEKEKLRKDLDILLTASYFNYAKYIWRGTVDPTEEDIAWNVQRKKIKYGKTLDAILDDDKHPFTKYEPLNEEYSKLKNILKDYRDMEKKGGWPSFKFEGKIKKGDTAIVIPLIRETLVTMGDLKNNNKSTLFDKELESGLISFQQRHGLESKGEINANTIKELNKPVSDRIKQIIVNMERWRWVPEKLSDNYLMVNIPEFILRVYENNKEKWRMNVIVGKTAHSTPIFKDEIEYIVFSPYWNVPKSIVVNELLPLLKTNPVIIEKENMEVYQGDPENTIDPYSIRWDTITEDNLPYQIRQKPGPWNSLGKVKFMFPNEYDVYLHDTPGQNLFSQTQRGFSHGCIRIEEPQKLAEYLLRDDETWNSERIEDAMKGTEEKVVKLQKKHPVYILYFTSWVDSEGKINFRNDIYSHDEKLAKSFFDQ